jgi:hypothetical protein
MCLEPNFLLIFVSFFNCNNAVRPKSHFAAPLTLVVTCRFREHCFDALAADLDRALGQANWEGMIQEYVQEMRDPVNRVPFAMHVSAFLVGCEERELNHKAERWEVLDERV